MNSTLKDALSHIQNGANDLCASEEASELWFKELSVYVRSDQLKNIDWKLKVHHAGVKDLMNACQKKLLNVKLVGDDIIFSVPVAFKAFFNRKMSTSQALTPKTQAAIINHSLQQTSQTNQLPVNQGLKYKR